LKIAPGPFDDFDELFKVIVVGDGHVGKTSLSARFSTGKFEKDYILTIGVGIMVSYLEYNDRRFKITIWDTGGQERFANVRPIYYNGAAAALVCFSINSKESFKNVEKWVQEVDSHRPGIPKVLVGTKYDLEKEREVSKEEIKKKMKKLKIPFFETSAKDGLNVEKPFVKLTLLIDSDERRKGIRL